MAKAKRTVPEHYRDGGPSVDWYDLREAQPGSLLDGDVAFYLGQVRQVGGPVLELASGTGRVALEIAGDGFEVVGLDYSPSMLRRARAKAKASPPAGAVRFVRGDMSRFELHRRFGAIVIAYRSFQHLLTAEAQRSCLVCAHRHLRRGGRLALHLFDPRLDLCLPDRNSAPGMTGTVADPRTGHTLEVSTRDRRNDPLAQTFEERWTWTERDAAGAVTHRSEDRLRLRWTYRHEMAYLLELTGFRARSCHSDFAGGPPRYGAEQVWVAEKA